jgi:TonB family protein
LTISENGNVVSVNILESPHKSISNAVIVALKQWKFIPFTIKGKPEKVTGKITYYFIVDGEKNRVESPF